MPKTIWVKAGKHGPVHRPGSPGTRKIEISTGRDLNTIGDEPVEVTSDRFIRGRLRAGDLLEVAAPAAPAKTTPAKDKE